jgi:hypothetical protein
MMAFLWGGRGMGATRCFKISSGSASAARTHPAAWLSGKGDTPSSRFHPPKPPTQAPTQAPANAAHPPNHAAHPQVSNSREYMRTDETLVSSHPIMAGLTNFNGGTASWRDVILPEPSAQVRVCVCVCMLACEHPTCFGLGTCRAAGRSRTGAPWVWGQGVAARSVPCCTVGCLHPDNQPTPGACGLGRDPPHPET